jgi:hypothetical protein
VFDRRVPVGAEDGADLVQQFQGVPAAQAVET